MYFSFLLFLGIDKKKVENHKKKLDIVSGKTENKKEEKEDQEENSEENSTEEQEVFCFKIKLLIFL